MVETLQHLFAAVCGQPAEHTWAPGGILLPLCQRCTGVYAGAATAALLHLLVRPKLDSRWLELHGVFLLLMVPFGLHWVPQGPALRAASGVLFGFGVLAFLWLPVARLVPAAARRSHAEEPSMWHRRVYLIVLAVTLVAVPWLGIQGGTPAALVLMTICCGGALAFMTIVLVNLLLLVAGAVRSGIGRTPAMRRL